MHALALLIGSRLGRQAALILLVLAILALIVWRAFVAGHNDAVTRRKLGELETVRRKLERNNEISSLSVDARRERLRQWVRDG